MPKRWRSVGYAPIDPTAAALAVVDHLVESGALRVDPAELAEREAAGLASEGCDVAVRRCRRLRVGECSDMKCRLQDVAEAIDGSPGDGKVGESNVYVIGGFDVSWVHVRKGADVSVLDALLEVDAYEVEPHA